MAPEVDIKQVFGRRIKRVIVSGVSGALVWRLRSCPQLPARLYTAVSWASSADLSMLPVGNSGNKRLNKEK